MLPTVATHAARNSRAAGGGSSGWARAGRVVGMAGRSCCLSRLRQETAATSRVKKRAMETGASGLLVMMRGSRRLAKGSVGGEGVQVNDVRRAGTDCHERSA